MRAGSITNLTEHTSAREMAILEAFMIGLISGKDYGQHRNCLGLQSFNACQTQEDGVCL